MVFDIGFCVLLIIFIGLGYRSGLVSMILSLAAVVVALLGAMYVSSRWLLIDYPIFGYWLQTLILFAIFGFILRKLISVLKFEKIFLVGFVSRILGGALYGFIFAAIVFFVVLAVLSVSPSTLDTNFPHSYVIGAVREAWASIQSVGGLPDVAQDVVKKLR
jgi:uncharacterized membrane protein required for colicin V production